MKAPEAIEICRIAHERDERADLRGAEGIYIFGGIGKTNRMGYARVESGKVVFGLGCHFGHLKETVAAIREKYGQKSTYEAQVRLASKIMSE